MVHIDLGIAFEQGLFLNTPELVPFRLTQDVVDGMGAVGVEGSMRRCCEETLRVSACGAAGFLIELVFIVFPKCAPDDIMSSCHTCQYVAICGAAARRRSGCVRGSRIIIIVKP